MIVCFHWKGVQSLDIELCVQKCRQHDEDVVCATQSMRSQFAIHFATPCGNDAGKRSLPKIQVKLYAVLNNISE